MNHNKVQQLKSDCLCVLASCVTAMMLEVTPKHVGTATYLKLQDGYKNIIMRRAQTTAGML